MPVQIALSKREEKYCQIEPEKLLPEISLSRSFYSAKWLIWGGLALFDLHKNLSSRIAFSTIQEYNDMGKIYSNTISSRVSN